LIVGVAALGLILAQKGTPTAAAVSTVRIASATQEDLLSPPVRQSVKLPKRRVPKRRPHFAGQRRRAIRQPNDDGHAGSVWRQRHLQSQRPEPEHYFQGFGPRDHAIEGRCHGVGTQIAGA
jgi:hypothetical protein